MAHEDTRLMDNGRNSPGPSDAGTNSVLCSVVSGYHRPIGELIVNNGEGTLPGPQGTVLSSKWCVFGPG